MLTLISLSVAGKWRSILSFWLGYFIAATIMYLVLLKTLSLLPDSFGIVFIFLKAIAAIIFINMGMHGLREKVSEYEEGSIELRKSIDDKGLLAKFGVGFVLAVSNPFDIVFILSVVPALTGITNFTTLDILTIRGIVAVTDFLVHASYCVPLLFIRNFLSVKFLDRLRTFSSMAMILIGFYIFINMLLKWDLLQGNLLLN